MDADKFLRWETFGIMALGLLAFVLDMAGGVLFGKLTLLAVRQEIQPADRGGGNFGLPDVCPHGAKVGQEYDYDNFLLMHAMGANVAGQLGSV